MFSGNRQRLIGIVSAYALAVAIGVSAALAGVKPASDIAYADHNCTRYGPFSYPVNTNCTVYDWFSGEGFHTSGFAQRDSNFIAVSADRWLYLWYDGLPDTFGYGLIHSAGGNANQHKAYCSWNGAEVNGRCTTRWD